MKITQTHLIEERKVKALELLGVELRGQRNIACQALQLLHEIPALSQRHASAAPAHLHAGVRRGLLTDRGDQAVVLDLRLKGRNGENKKRVF